MANQLPGHIEFAGDYALESINIHTHFGEQIDIKKLVIELNIYESIFKNSLTGSIVIGDAQNLIGKLEINGTERISFKLFTPGVTYAPVSGNVNRAMLDASVETGHPFHVYKITDRKQINAGTSVYTLHFGSREFMRNLRTKVSQSYEGRLDTTVLKILMDKNYLDTKKEMSMEPTGNSDKIVIPNMRPYDAINMIAKKSLAQKSGGVGYYFYETPKGIYFRSWDNMVSVKGSYDRPIKQEFYYMPMNINDEVAISNKIQHDFKSVESYQFLNNFHDVAANTALGTYGHKVISHNLFDKSYKETSYNYANEFSNSKHTDLANEKSVRERYAIAANSNIDEDGKKISQYDESRVSLQSTTQFLHNTDVGGYGLDVVQDGPKLAESVSQRSQVRHGTTLKLVIKGQSYLEVGDLIKFNLLKVEPSPDHPGEYDKQYSGKYVITKIRHQILSEKYTMAIECAKDSVRYGFQANDFKIEKNPNHPGLRDTYEKEEPDRPNRHA